MSENRSGEKRDQSRAEWFSQTSWTTINTAKQGGTPAGRLALEQLCQTYWYPLYTYVRRLGQSPQDAEDVTQAFFYHLLEKDFLEGVDRARGRFRSFLLAALKHFLENERRYRSAAKRGGGRTILSLDEETAEGRYVREPVSDLSPEMSYERAWAATLLEEALHRLRAEYQASGKTALFDQVKCFLDGNTELGSYKTLAAQVGMTPNALGVAVHRLRQRYGELIRDEITRTIDSPFEVDEEMRHLLSLLAEA